MGEIRVFNINKYGFNIKNAVFDKKSCKNICTYLGNVVLLSANGLAL